MPTASHNIGANQSSQNSTGTSSSFPTGGPLLKSKTANTPNMLDAGDPKRFPRRNHGEGRRPPSLSGSMHRATPGMGYGAHDSSVMEEATGYRPSRPITKDMTMSDKGPGAFFRRLTEPTAETGVDDREFRATYLKHGAFTVSARSDRSELSFAKQSDHPRWDPRASVGDPSGAEVRRQGIAVSDLSSGEVGRSSPGHLFTRKARGDDDAQVLNSSSHKSRRNLLSSTSDRQRLMESGKIGDFDQTAAIHAARAKFRQEQRRGLHAKKTLTSGKHCEEALHFSQPYRDGDEHLVLAPTGPREQRTGLGVVPKRVGSSPRAAMSLELQTSGDVGAFSKQGTHHGYHYGTVMPSARRDRMLGQPTVGRVHEGMGSRTRLRGVRPHTVSDLSRTSSSQVGQMWTHDKDQWWCKHDPSGDPSSGQGDQGVGNDPSGVVNEDGGGGGGREEGGGDEGPEVARATTVQVQSSIPHWQEYGVLHHHPPGHVTARATEEHHRFMLTSGIVGSHVSSRGPRPSEAVDFNEPHGCPLKPCKNDSSGYRPPMGTAGDGLPLALKPGRPVAAQSKASEWRAMADKGGIDAHDKLNAFHKSAKASFLAASVIHAQASPSPLIGVTMTKTAREKSKLGIVERSIAGDADLGWSHALRGQKW